MKSLCSGMTLRTMLGDRRRRKDGGRKRLFFFAIAAPQGSKVHTEEVRLLCFLAFLSNFELARVSVDEIVVIFFFNRKLVMPFSKADRMVLDSTSSPTRKWDFLQGSFRKGRGFYWRSMVICRFVMTWIKI